MYFASQAEATIAIASVVLSADMVGSREEQHFLFTKVRGMDAFKGLDHATFHKIMVDVNERLFGEKGNSSILLTKDGMNALCQSLKDAIPENGIESAFRMACEMAHVDGLNRIEEEVLFRLGTGLGLTSESVRVYLRLTHPA